MAEQDERNVYGFASESDFDRASRAIRYAEAEMRGSQEHRRPGSSSSPNTLTVQVQEDANADGYYRGQFTYYDVAQQSWVLHGDCFIFGINGEELKFSPATRYHGREIGSLEDIDVPESILPLVEVVVGGGGDGGGDSTAIGVLDGALAKGSFATMSVWVHNVGGSLVDSGTNITVYERDTGPLPAGASVAAIRGAPGSTYFVVGEPAPTLRGKLDGSLSYQGSATMSVWTWNGSAEVDATDNVTVYDWHLSSGQSIPAGTQVSASYDRRSGRYYVGSSQWCT